MDAETQLKSIEVPKDVAVRIDGMNVKVKGPKGEVMRDFNNPSYNHAVQLLKNGGIEIKFGGKKTYKAVAGTIEAHVKNMILGVTVGFEYRLKIVYSHFPISITMKDGEIHVKNFLGEKGARIARISKGCDVKVDKEEIVLTGIDIESLGQTAQRIEQACRLSGRDRRIFQDGIFLTSRRLGNGEKI